MLLDHVAPLVDSLEIEYIHLTPWSLDLDNMDVGYQGGRFQLEKGHIRYCLSSLLMLNVNLKLSWKNIAIDAREYPNIDSLQDLNGARNSIRALLSRNDLVRISGVQTND